ncbi:hypothetical protein [Winogradskyella sp.]|uniref:hypothetical protein n=1 Tax=Winogradskyella sp. TaxID=1883156 RepID=UPI001B27B7CF|nr:hypothetical protein [Winogradskyella sp.]MBO6880782.1 hypothetical protein [Winogradskyella sp.]
MKLRKTIGILFIISQIVLIIYAKFVPERFFCWAPFDEHTYLDIDVEVNGKLLTKKEIAKRYRYKSKGWEPRSINNVFSIIRQYESTYGKEDNASVKVKYATNGNEERIWYFNQ